MPCLLIRVEDVEGALVLLAAMRVDTLR
jgi:hypothetical protein